MILPQAEALRQLNVSQMAQVIGLHLNPLSAHVVTRCLELRLFERAKEGLERSDLAHPHALGRESGALDLLIRSAESFGLLKLEGSRIFTTELARDFLTESGKTPLVGLNERFRLYAGSVGHLPSALRHIPFSDRTLWSDRASAERQDHVFAHRKHNSPQANPRRRYFWDTSTVLVLPHLTRALPSAAVIVDIGCALGSFAAMMKRLFPGAHVLGVDIDFRDLDYLAVAQQLIRDTGEEVQLVPANVLQSTAGLPTADLVTGNRLLSGVTPELGTGWVQCFFDLLKPGGRFVGVDFLPTGNALHDAACYQHSLLLMAWNYRELIDNPVMNDLDERVTWGWTPPWSPSSISDVFRKVGFEEVKVSSLIPPFAVVEATKPKA